MPVTSWLESQKGTKMSILVREHRGTLEESMATVFEVSTWAQLNDEIAKRTGIVPEAIYTMLHGNDERNGWTTTYSIQIQGYGVFGFSNGPLKEEVEG